MLYKMRLALESSIEIVTAASEEEILALAEENAKKIMGTKEALVFRVK